MFVQRCSIFEQLIVGLEMVVFVLDFVRINICNVFLQLLDILDKTLLVRFV